jgi:tRNA pseudouridine38-40 synthase
MVRSIVGTLLEIGLNKRPFEDIRLIIESRDRSKAGFSVPAKGLFLTKIIYPSSVYLKNEK